MMITNWHVWYAIRLKEQQHINSSRRKFDLCIMHIQHNRIDNNADMYYMRAIAMQCI